MAVHIDDRDWSVLALGERIRQIEVEGYVVIPDLLSEPHVKGLRTETAKLDTTPVDYSVHQRGHGNVECRGGLLTDLIAHPLLLRF